MLDLFGKMALTALFVIFPCWIGYSAACEVARARAAFVPRIPGETFDCQVHDDPNSYCRGLPEEVLKLNSDLRAHGRPELSIHDIGAMTARDVSRLRMAIRYNVDPNQLDGQMRTVTVGKTHRIVEE